MQKSQKSVTKDAEKDSVTLTRGPNEGQKDIIQFDAANRTVGVVFFFFSHNQNDVLNTHSARSRRLSSWVVSGVIRREPEMYRLLSFAAEAKTAGRILGGGQPL